MPDSRGLVNERPVPFFGYPSEWPQKRINFFQRQAQNARNKLTLKARPQGAKHVFRHGKITSEDTGANIQRADDLRVATAT